LLALKLPSARRKVEAEMARVRKDIRDKLLPQGPNVIRHLALPAQGKGREAIVAEMERMDADFDHAHSWKDGKVSGAIYRSYFIVFYRLNRRT
jgi:sphinganine-1-phosphate aldolase